MEGWLLVPMAVVRLCGAPHCAPSHVTAGAHTVLGKGTSAAGSQYSEPAHSRNVLL